MDKVNNSLQFKAKLDSFEKINDRFLRAKCYVMALGKNRNKSYFSEESVNKAYPSLAYKPVIGHLMEDENGNYYLGGHDYKVDLKNGFKLVSQCVPFGVTVAGDVPVYEDVVEKDGSVVKYLTCEVILWIGRYPELENAIYNSETYFNHSMEVMYSKSQPLKDDNSYTDITDFLFDALCMLNKSDDPKFNVDPCFPSASITPFSYEESKKNISELLDEMKNELKSCFAKIDEEQGGKTMDKKEQILLEYNKTQEDLDFSIESLTEDELASKMEELFGQKTEEEPVLFSATYREKLKKLTNAVDKLSNVETDVQGNYVSETYAYLSDFSDVYAFVKIDKWSKDADYLQKIGRIAYSESDDGITLGAFEEMVAEWLTLTEKAEIDKQRTSFEKVEAEFEAYKESHSVTDAEYEELSIYRDAKVKEERAIAETELLNSFEESIGELDEFEELKKNAGAFSLESLEKECYCILGQHSAKNTPKRDENKTITFAVVDDTDAKTKVPYGGVIDKYLNK